VHTPAFRSGRADSGSPIRPFRTSGPEVVAHPRVHVGARCLGRTVTRRSTSRGSRRSRPATLGVRTKSCQCERCSGARVMFSRQVLVPDRRAEPDVVVSARCRAGAEPFSTPPFASWAIRGASGAGTRAGLLRSSTLDRSPPNPAARAPASDTALVALVLPKGVRAGHQAAAVGVVAETSPNFTSNGRRTPLRDRIRDTGSAARESSGCAPWLSPA